MHCNYKPFKNRMFASFYFISFKAISENGQNYMYLIFHYLTKNNKKNYLSGKNQLCRIFLKPDIKIILGLIKIMIIIFFFNLDYSNWSFLQQICFLIERKKWINFHYLNKFSIRINHVKKNNQIILRKKFSNVEFP